MPVVNYLWDTVEDNIVEEFDDAGNSIADYTTEPDLFGNVISQHRSAQSSFFHYDALGSALGVTDEAQNVTDTFAYTAFGGVTERAGTTESRLQYVGRKQYYWDSQLQHISVRRRHYDPMQLRWLSTDPLGDTSGYVYVSNQPLVAIDPFGLMRLRVQADAFIPFAWVTFLWPVWFLKGDTRQFATSAPPPSASRVTTVVRVEMESCVSNRNPLVLATTIISPSTRRTLYVEGPGLPTWVWDQTLIGSYWHLISASRTGPCSVDLIIRTSASIPWSLAPGAPAIDWDYKFSLHAFEVHEEEGTYVVVSGKLGGSHDGFPAYEVFLSNSRVYSRSPDATIMSLFPPMEITVDRLLSTILGSERMECCECIGSYQDWIQAIGDWGESG
jgi:RHS repeat-associated protein